MNKHNERAELIRKLNAIVDKYFTREVNPYGSPPFEMYVTEEGEVLQNAGALLEAQPAADDKAGGDDHVRPAIWVNGLELSKILSGDPGVRLDAMPDEGMRNARRPDGSKYYDTQLYTRPQPQAEVVSPDKAKNFYLAVCNFLVWIGREGIVHADDPIIDQLSNALHDIDGGVFKDSLKWPQAEVRAPDGYVLVPVEPTDDMLHCAQDRVYSLFLVDARNIWDAMLSAAPKPQDDLPAILKKQAS